MGGDPVISSAIARVTRMSRRRGIAAAAILMLALGVVGVAAAADSNTIAKPSIAGAPANPSTVDTARFTFTDATAGVGFQCKLDSATYSSCSSGVSYSALKLGAHTFSVRAVKANKTSDAATFAWNIVVTPPTITAAPAAITQATTASFAFIDSQAGVSFRCSLDAAAATACTSPIAYNNLAERGHSFSVFAVNTLGASAPVVVLWVVDRTPPPAPTITSAPSDSTSTSATFAFTDSESGVTFRCSLDGAAPAACTTPKTFASLAVGTHIFSVIAIDKVGNASSAATKTWAVQAEVASVKLAGNVTRLLAPGLSSPVDVQITNTNHFDIVINNLQLTVQRATTKNGQANPSCDGATNLTIRQFSGAAFKVKESRTVSLSTLGLSQSTWPVITMPNLPVNQDACKNTTFTFAYSATVTKAQS
jgi:hypothetical protein